MADINEEIELEEEIEDCVVAEATKEAKEEKITLDFSLDPAERIKIEIDNTEDANEKAIGSYLLEQFAKDEVLKNCYKDRKITLNAISKYIVECAKKYLKNKNGMIEDKIVFGWVLHYVQDEEVKIPVAETYELTPLDKDKAKKDAIAKYEAEQVEKLRQQEKKKAEAEKRKIEKELAKEKASGTMNLFEDF